MFDYELVGVYFQGEVYCLTCEVVGEPIFAEEADGLYCCECCTELF